MWLAVGMYLRETRRTNKDGSVVRYLQLAHNERHPVTGAPTAKVIHNFGRADQVDRDALARLVSSISRVLGPEQQATLAAQASGAGEVEVLESRRMSGAWTLDRVWERLGIGTAVRTAAKGRKLDADLVERVLFALVAQRALEPASKLAATRWVAERVWIEHLPGLSDDQAYRAMDFLVGAFGHSKDFRTDLPQVVIAMAVTRDGVPVKCWTFPGNTADTSIIRTIKDDLAGWNLHRMVWVADRGFASAANRAYLTRGGGHYIHAEKLRHTNREAAAALARPGRYKTVAGNLRVKEVQVAPGGDGDLDLLD